VTQAAREVLSRIDGLVGENETALRSSLRNIETVTSTLAQNSQRLNKVMAGLENLTGSGDNRGEIAQAAEAIRKLAENLDKRTDEISAGLTRFSNSGLKEFAAFAVDGRRTLAELNKAIKNSLAAACRPGLDSRDQARRLSHSRETEPRRRAPLHPQGLRSRRPLHSSRHGGSSLAGTLVPY
jgi:ABC-type transporter Mla subunit MlaD